MVTVRRILFLRPNRQTGKTLPVSADDSFPPDDPCRVFLSGILLAYRSSTHLNPGSAETQDNPMILRKL